MVQLSNDILQGILCRLPVKCLLRFKSVSKSWLALINSSNFVKSHLNQSVQTKINLSLYLSCIRTTNRVASGLYRVDFDSLEKGDGNLQPLNFNYNPLSHLNYRTSILGSCNGLVCISNTMDIVLLWNSSTRKFIDLPSSALLEIAKYSNLHQYSSYGFGYENNRYNPLRRHNRTGLRSNGLICMTYKMDIVVIWNPSTRKSIKLPFASVGIPNQSNLHKYCTYGIGYDKTSDDYKVVRIVLVLDTVFDYEVKVYSLKSNSWHKSKKFSDQYPYLDRTEKAIVGGAMHWMSIGTDNRRFILAFDLGKETYRVIQHPEYRDPDFSSCLANLGGYLSITCHHYSGIVDIWLLKEYRGENESWSRLAQNIPFPVIHAVKSVAYSKSGKKVLLRKDFGLVWYNLESELLEDIRFHADQNNNSFEFEVIDSCLESLVSIDVTEAG